MYFFKVFFLILALLPASPQASQDNKLIHATITLESIEVEKVSEKAGDEIYLDVTEYSTLGTSQDYRIPKKPLHWLSRELDQVKKLMVWQGDIKEDEEVKIIFSVVEEDALWDPDDLIGSAQITLANHQGNLIKEWGVPIFEERVETEMEKSKEKSTETSSKTTSNQLFIMKGDHSHYRVLFSLNQSKSQSKT